MLFDVTGSTDIALFLLRLMIAAGLLVFVMLGAIQKKAFVWKTGFRGDESNGWYHDLLYLVCCPVILTTGGGSIGFE